MKYLLAITSLYMFVQCHANVSHDKCAYIEHVGMRKNTLNVTKVGCPNNTVCRKTFNVSIVTLLPYTHNNIHELFFKKCCGTCAKFKVVNRFANISEVSIETIKSSDFIYPFFASYKTKMLYGHHFIPYWETSDALYITKIKVMGLRSIIGTFPVIIVCLLLSVISGFLVWLMETWSNEQQFPRPFLIGWFDGIWWSFVTMTTVGYGDKVPKTFPARMFTIIWTLIGIISCAVITALLTTEILKINSPPPPNMEGATVGALPYRDYDSLIIAKHGGTVKYATAENCHVALFQLITMLEKDEVDGFLVDKYTNQYFDRHVRHGTKIPRCRNQTKDLPVKEKSEFFAKHTIQTKMTYHREKLAYGILVRNYEDYIYFGNLLRDNQYHHEIKRALRWNRNVKKFTDTKRVRFYSVSNNLFSFSNQYFQTTVTVIVTTVGLISLFGLSYEIWRRYQNGERYLSGADPEIMLTGFITI